MSYVPVKEDQAPPKPPPAWVTEIRCAYCHKIKCGCGAEDYRRVKTQS